MLRRLVQSSAARAAAAAPAAPGAGAAAAYSTSRATAAAAAEAPGLRQAAFGVISKAGGKPLHNKEVFKQLDAALPKEVIELVYRRPFARESVVVARLLPWKCVQSIHAQDRD